MIPEQILRRDVTQATLDRYRDQPFAYGRNDCVQMVAFHLRAMGHKVLLSKGGRYQSALGAVKALKRAGFPSLYDALDAMHLERIAPAAALAGDIISLPQEEGAPLEALFVALGNGRVLGWIDGVETASVLQPVLYVTGWRVPWQKR